MQRAALAALTLAVAAGIPDLAILPAKAQEAGGVLTTTLSQSLVADSNYNLDDPSPGTSYYGDTRAALDYLNVTPTQSLALGLDTGLRALDEAGQSFDFVVASPSTANFDFSHEGADTSFDVGARIRSRRVDYLRADRHRRAAARRPDRLSGGFDRVPLRRRHRLRHRDQLAEHLRIQPRGDELRLQRGHRPGEPRAAALGPGRRHLDAADHPGLRHRRRPRLLLVLGRQHDRRGDHRRRGRLRDRLYPDRELPHPRRPRLCRPQARPDDRRRPRHHRAQHRPGDPRRLPLRPGGLHPDRRGALDHRRPPGPPERRGARLLQPPPRPDQRPRLPALRRRPGRLGLARHRRRARLHPRAHPRLEPRARRLLRHPGRRGRSRRARHRPHRLHRELHPQPDRDGQRPDRLRLPATASRTRRTRPATASS